MVDSNAVLRAWKERGFSGGVWIDRPGQRWEGFVHEVDELFMVVDGEVELELEGRAWHPAPGEEVLIPAGALHSVRNKGRVTSHWLYAYARR